MLPTFLFDSYKRYKFHSDTVATWLANTAHQCGYQHDLLTNKVHFQQKPPNLKGRAKTLTRQAKENIPPGRQGDSTVSEPTHEGPKRLIASKDFTIMAEWIATSTNARIEVPTSFVSALDKAIAVRRRHHKYWHSQGEKDDRENKKANDSHKHFIHVLQNVREILQPIMPTRLRKDPLTQPIEGVPILNKPVDWQTANQYGILTIQDPSVSFLDFEPVSSGKEPKILPTVQCTVDQELEPAEVDFAIFCLFNDFHNIRKWLQQIWQSYKQGELDLIPVSVATNTAMEFVKRLYENFIEMFPKHTDFKHHIICLYFIVCQAANKKPGFEEQPGDEMNFEVWEKVEPTLYPTFIHLKNFNGLIEKGTLLGLQRNHINGYDPLSDRASKSPRDKFLEDEMLLQQILPDFSVIALGYATIPVEDEITRGVRELGEEKEVPIWLTFATQVFLDIHHILREQVRRGFYEFVDSTKHVENNIQHMLNFHKNVPNTGWRKSFDRNLSRILRHIKYWVESDTIVAIRKHQVRLSKTQPIPPPEPFLLLKHHPLYCGLLSYSITALEKEASIQFANTWGSVLASAHLYNALRQERLLSDAWPDMDLAFIMHRTEDMFIGSFPKTIDNYVNRFDLATGHSVTRYAKKTRRGGFMASKAGPRELNEIPLVFRMFMARYCHNGYRTCLSPDNINTILKKHTKEGDNSDPQESREVKTPKFKSHVRDEKPLSPRPSGNQPSRSRKHQMKPPQSAIVGVDSIHFLKALLNNLQSEMLELTFDHVHLHMFSRRLLCNLQKELGGDLRKFFGKFYTGIEDPLPSVVGYILSLAMSQELSKLETVVTMENEDVVTRPIFAKAAVVLREMLKAEVAAKGNAKMETEVQLEQAPGPEPAPDPELKPKIKVEEIIVET